MSGGDALLRQMTPEQAAAYVNATAVVALSELMSMHWQNEEHKILMAAGAIPAGTPLPNSPQRFQDRIRTHCVMHPEMLRLFELAKGR